jgi:dihydroorotate dehydrogenase
MYSLIRPLLFRLDPEQAHRLTLGLLRVAGAIPPLCVMLRAWFAGPHRQVEMFGLNFANPVGLAAGYDKDGLGWRGLSCLGFGHIEVGTVTPRPQPGNPQPRLFRLPEDRALINRMGFPGRGAEFVRRHLQNSHPRDLVLGVNLGKNKDTSLETAAEDYLNLLRAFAPLADYLAINVSSPNTIGLRRLQARTALEALLRQLEDQRRAEELRLAKRIPLLVKLAPDLSEEELDDALEAILQTGMDGVIAANTTVERSGIHSKLAGEAGGLSGAPLRALSTRMVRQIVQRTGGGLPVIGVGGILDAESAREKLDAGASLVQVYTGLVYRGPGLVKEILRGLLRD